MIQALVEATQNYLNTVHKSVTHNNITGVKISIESFTKNKRVKAVVNILFKETFRLIT